MKVKNIVFSGFAAAILAMGMANAAPSIATQGYVDQEVGKVQGSVTNLNKTLTDDYATTTAVQDTVNTSIQQAVTADNGAIKAALDDKANADTVTDLATTVTNLSTTVAGKENSANKKSTIDANSATASTDFPTVSAVATYTQNAISEAVTSGININTDKIEDGAITEAKLSTELAGKINNAQTETQVGDAIDAALESYTNTTDMNAAIATAKSEAIADAATAGNLAYAVKETEDTANTANTNASKALANIGTLANLTTEDKTSAVAAINEVKGVTGTQGSAITTLQADVTTLKQGTTIANNAVTEEKLDADLAAKIDAAQTASDVEKAISDALTTEDGVIKAAVDAKQNKLTSENFVGGGSVAVTIAEDGKITVSGTDNDTVTTAETTGEGNVVTSVVADDNGALSVTKGMKAIPAPSETCTSESGRCVLSVDTTGNYTWIDVTVPLQSSETTAE